MRICIKILGISDTKNFVRVEDLVSGASGLSAVLSASSLPAGLLPAGLLPSGAWCAGF